MSTPWYISSDGSTFIIKDIQEDFREMTEEEREKYCRKPVIQYQAWNT